MGIGIDEKGREIVDSTPLELPLGFEHPEPLESLLRKSLVDISKEARMQGYETEEEANDFDVEDDGPDPLAPWEYSVDQELEFKEQVFKEQERIKKFKEEKKSFDEWRSQEEAKRRAAAQRPQAESQD